MSLDRNRAGWARSFRNVIRLVNPIEPLYLPIFVGARPRKHWVRDKDWTQRDRSRRRRPKASRR
ncbi:hypothetical protein [Methylobacterium sp. AMS5]|uniref:hypothetical protein n=1 Tax=Methylobacterium sp. AMS5 TaxID=925818 RepID=UPI00074F826A|nr:hypothetical protein [Methylobacterium sp. AMS5]AMB48310.1 hypothetical protein Y590_25415 [Methylobacterium sp. AMS5]